MEPRFFRNAPEMIAGMSAYGAAIWTCKEGYVVSGLANAIPKFVVSARLGTIRSENPIRMPEKRSSAACRSLAWGPSSAMRSKRFVTPRGSLAPPDRFSVSRLHGLLQGFLRERSRAVRPQPIHDVR